VKARRPAGQAAMLREMHHRVNNNFQVIVSVLNLQKRLLPCERAGDLRMVEAHVQAIAAAYRIAKETNTLGEVTVSRLVAEVVDELRHIARISPGHVVLDVPARCGVIGLDRAIALGLYLAVVVPPLLDRVAAAGGVFSVILRQIEGRRAVLTIAPAVPAVPAPSGRDSGGVESVDRGLAAAYLGKIGAKATASADRLCLTFELENAG
jgi:hypothetical protein